MKNVLASRLGIAVVCALGALAMAISGCNRSITRNDQDIRQKSAEATRQIQKGRSNSLPIRKLLQRMQLMVSMRLRRASKTE